jgi:hypothetical protein
MSTTPRNNGTISSRLENANCADQLLVEREDRPPDAEGEIGVAAGQDGVSRAENEAVMVDDDPTAGGTSSTGTSVSL